MEVCMCSNIAAPCSCYEPVVVSAQRYCRALLHTCSPGADMSRPPPIPIFSTRAEDILCLGTDTPRRLSTDPGAYQSQAKSVLIEKNFIRSQ